MTKVYVAIYEHRHGQDVRVFDHIDKVEAWRQSIADEYFDDEFYGRKRPESIEDLTEEYWTDIQEEWFIVETTEVE